MEEKYDNGVYEVETKNLTLIALLGIKDIVR